MKTDFTYGNVFKQLVYFSGPIILANLLQISFQFVDSLWVGNLLGAKALGAAAVSGTVFFTVLSFVLGVNNAALTILAQQKGKGDKKGLASYVNAFVVLMTAMRGYRLFFHRASAFASSNAWQYDGFGCKLFEHSFYRHYIFIRL